MKKIIFIILPFFLLLVGCPKVPSDENSNSKEKLASDFEINLHKSGGMLPISEKLRISAEECSWTYWRYKNETVVKWKATTEELEGLMRTLNSKDFREITSRSEEEVYDRGGYSISIKNREKVSELDNSGRTFIEEKWIPSYNAIKKGILDYSNTKVFENKIYLHASLSKAVQESDLRIEVDFDGEMAYNSESTQINPFDGFKAFVGMNQVNLVSYYRDSVSRYNGRVIFQQDMEWLEIEKTDKEVLIDLIDDKLVITKKP
jgi:hypothetical protein